MAYGSAVQLWLSQTRTVASGAIWRMAFCTWAGSVASMAESSAPIPTSSRPPSKLACSEAQHKGLLGNEPLVGVGRDELREGNVEVAQVRVVEVGAERHPAGLLDDVVEGLVEVAELTA